MWQKRSVLLAALAGASVLLACEGMLVLGGFDFLENRSFDLRVRWAPPREAPAPEILIIDIDNASFAALSKTQLGRWPWTRALWAELVNYLHDSGARWIVFDAIFSGQESEEVDQEFARAIAAADNVLLAFALAQYEANYATSTAPLQTEGIPGAVRVNDAAGVPRLSPEKYQPDLPLPTLVAAARGLGCITALPDPDGTVRRVALYYRWGDRYYPSLSLATAAHDLRLPNHQPAELGEREFHWQALRVPTTPGGMLVPHWRPDLAAFPRLPLWMVTCSMFPWQCEDNKPFYKPEQFRDKIVLIGASALGAFDFSSTPVAPVTPGVLVHAAALDTLLRQRAIALPPGFVIHLLLVVMAGLAAATIWGFRAATRQSLVATILVGAYVLLCLLAFGKWELWLPMAAPLSTLLASCAAHGLTRYVTTGRELRQTRQTLSRYMSPEVVEHIMAHGGPDQLRGQRQEITVMFSDIRNFTKMSEMRTPVEVLEILNRYLDAMTEIVFNHHGVVDKFIGDGILCYWGAFGNTSSHALLAAATAAKMVAKLADLNQNWKAAGLPELNIGIGINTGEAVFGNLGAGKKIEFTVLGDTVNVASRLEAMNKEFGTRVILSEATRNQLGEDVAVRLLREVTIRGREQPMKVFELIRVTEGETTYDTQPAAPAPS